VGHGHRGGPRRRPVCCRAQVTQIDPATNEVVDAIDLGPGSEADLWVDGSGIWALVFTAHNEGLEVVRVHLGTTKWLRASRSTASGPNGSG